MDRRRDPRTIVTPYAFAVHPDLLGRPLATPWQRLAAIAIDGIVIFGLSRIGGLTLAVATTLLLFWLAIRKPSRDTLGKLFRVAVGCLAFLVLGITLVVVLALETADRFMEDPDTQTQIMEALDSAGVEWNLTGDVGGREVDLTRVITAFPEFLQLQDAETAEEAETLLTELARAGRAGGMPLGEIRGVLEALAPEDVAWSDQAQELIDRAMVSLRTEIPAETPSSEEVEETPIITDPLAADSIEALNELVQDLGEERADAETRLRRARRELEATENTGILDRLLGLLDDLGIGFGWGAIYLTIIQVWWKGTTVGKKILGIRVVMIDKRPLNIWLSFERAGGYAAGLATGLLGFAQIFWDPNRQAIHDKVSETIVIQDGKEPVPGPWLKEETPRRTESS